MSRCIRSIYRLLNRETFPVPELTDIGSTIRSESASFWSVYEIPFSSKYCPQQRIEDIDRVTVPFQISVILQYSDRGTVSRFNLEYGNEPHSLYTVNVQTLFTDWYHEHRRHRIMHRIYEYFGCFQWVHSVRTEYYGQTRICIMVGMGLQQSPTVRTNQLYQWPPTKRDDDNLWQRLLCRFETEEFDGTLHPLPIYQPMRWMWLWLTVLHRRNLVIPNDVYYGRTTGGGVYDRGHQWMWSRWELWWWRFQYICNLRWQYNRFERAISSTNTTVLQCHLVLGRGGAMISKLGKCGNFW